MVLKMLLFGKYGVEVEVAEKGYEAAMQAVEDLKDFVQDKSLDMMSLDAMDEVEDADNAVSNLMVEIENAANDEDFDSFCKFVKKLDDVKFDLLYAGQSCEDAANDLKGINEWEEDEAASLRRIKKFLIEAYDNVADFVHCCDLEIKRDNVG